MGPFDIALIALVVVAFVAAVRYTIKKKGTCTCGASCGGCCDSCAGCDKNKNDSEGA